MCAYDRVYSLASLYASCTFKCTMSLYVCTLLVVKGGVKGCMAMLQDRRHRTLHNWLDTLWWLIVRLLKISIYEDVFELDKPDKDNLGLSLLVQQCGV